ncbi:helix-turn-helix domain-containing protein [Streptomyces sedi]|uniref:Helix-turn-helix domain-containing protein n=1 Tax=Streptomyces sedi TaxID=555059 RepID=A0A5C4V8M1_9ACTN|nr:helix-turn-helix domain-containing protein [Streptomyces sedi]TNM32233.1 helix-turn-helix domain-containing protein [Streptomyces sedi]
MNSQGPAAGLTVNDIAALWKVPKGTIYRYAHTYRWRRYTDTGRTYYHPDDVTTTFDDLNDRPDRGRS